MDGNSVEREVIAIIGDVSGFDVQEIRPDMKLAEDLEIDSIKAIEIVVAIEKKYKLKIRDEDVPSITTVGQAISLVNNLLTAQETHAEA